MAGWRKEEAGQETAERGQKHQAKNHSHRRAQVWQTREKTIKRQEGGRQHLGDAAFSQPARQTTAFGGPTLPRLSMCPVQYPAHRRDVGKLHKRPTDSLPPGHLALGDKDPPIATIAIAGDTLLVVADVGYEPVVGS